MPAGEGWLTDGERERLASFTVAKRAAEWRLRRWAGKVAVAAWLAASLDPAGVEIANEPDGSPFARDGAARLPVSLSLSDRAGRAIAVVGEAGVEVGCDVELVEPRSDAFVADWFDEEEQAVVARAASPAMAALAANLVWSAKESALKVLREGLRRPLRSVSVRVAVDQSGGWQPWVAALAEGGEIEGWWRSVDGCVVTVASRPPSPPPRRLEPSGARAPR